MASVVSIKRKEHPSPTPEKDEDQDVKVVSQLNETRDVKKTKKGNWSEQQILDVKYCETEYYFTGHLRKVYPYFYEYKTFCKQRWVGKKVFDVLSTEFKSLPPENLRLKIQSGGIRVNGQVFDLDYKFKDNDFMSHRAHRHELPVLASPITIVADDDDVLVIDKPPSLPVHPCGRYRFNSVVAVLRKEYGYEDLKIVHRLDRLTSGLLVMAKNSASSAKFHSEISDRTVQKEYLCRVEGNFPDEEVIVDNPIDVLCRKIGASIVSLDGKESITGFKKLSFNGKSSLVHCKPRTGRTHQIRVHLQFLGFPIVNDPLYNSSAFGKNKGKDADYDNMDHKALLQSIRKEHSVDDWFLSRSDNDNDSQSGVESYKQSIKSYLGPDFATKGPEFDESKVSRDASCEECDIQYKEPEPKHMMLFLHALKYSGSDWSYETAKPFWAQDDYSML